MEKLKMHSPDLVAGNIEKIAALFPNCITETKDATGKLTRAVDFDLLKQELSGSVVEGPQERYRLDWPGKREALLAANAPIAKTLRPCREESVNFDATRNLFIEGDNLDCLKLINETFLGKVQLIYIDPPYNTGNDFLYSDRFFSSKEEYLQYSNQTEADSRQLVANPESNGRYHSAWLSMLYPRIKLASLFLKQSGLIFISIDDNEVANLRVMCDEIFGRSNFVSQLVWKKKSSGGQHTSGFLDFHEHILVYAKDRNATRELLISRTGEQLESFTLSDAHEATRGKHLLSPLKSWLDERKTLIYPIECPDGTLVTTQWVCAKDTFAQLKKEGRIIFKQNRKGEWSVYKKQYSKENGGLVKPPSVLDFVQTLHGKKEIKDLFGEDVMSFPKPTALISFIIESSTSGNDIIMDFFAGSGTTAHATFLQNIKDNGNRRFILIQLPEKCTPESEAFKSGFSTIADLAKERIRRCGAKLLPQQLGDIGLDIGFRALKSDSSNFNDILTKPDELTAKSLELALDNIRTDRNHEDLLFQVMLDWGLDLGLPISSEKIAGKTVYFVDGNALAACFETDISEELVTALAKLRVDDLPLLKVVFRDAGYADDSAKINVEQIFKLLSPTTELRTL